MTTLITGATRGLGLATTRELRRRGESVLCAGRDHARTAQVAAEVGATAVTLDMASLAAVRRAVDMLPAVDRLVCNAGVQVIRGQTTTEDGLEETFAVNHLAHLALVDGLLSRDGSLRQVVLIGSATHDPAVRTGTPDPTDDPVAGLARPGPDTEPARTAGLRRYATTKQLAAATAAGLAREHPDVHFATFDPGLMPGTGLARQYPPLLRLLWDTAFRALVVLPFASSPSASATSLARLLTEQPPPVPSGAYVDHRLRVRGPSERARDTGYQDAVLADSRQLLAGILGPGQHM